jgi:hypothetical protein
MAAQAVSGMVAATGKRSQGRRHRPGTVEQAGGSSLGRRGVKASGAEERGIGHGVKPRVWTSGAPVTATLALR